MNEEVRMPDRVALASDVDGIMEAGLKELEAVLAARVAEVDHGPQPVGHHLGRVFDGVWSRGLVDDGDEAEEEGSDRAVFLSVDAGRLMRVDKFEDALHEDVARHGVSFAGFLSAVVAEDRPGVEHVLRGGCFRDAAGRARAGVKRHDHALCFCGRKRWTHHPEADPEKRAKADREAAEAATLEADPVCFAEFRVQDPRLQRGYEWARILLAPEMPGGRALKHNKGLMGIVADIPDVLMHLDE